MQDHSLEAITAEVDSRVSPQPNAKETRALDGDERIATGALGLVLLASIGVWFISITTPLWLDETVSYWQASAPLGRIWGRQEITMPAYSYILWAVKSIFGSNQYVLRTPSILAMLAAVYVLYCIAREFFSPDVALAAAIVFCLHPLVIFAAIDARPYAFAVLVVNCATLALLRWIRTHEDRYAIALGVFSALIFYFHYLFGVVLVAFVFLLAMNAGHCKAFWPRLGKGLIAFFLLMLPVFPRLADLFRTSATHVFSDPPTVTEFVHTLAPGSIFALFVLTLLIAAVLQKVTGNHDKQPTMGITCLLLAIVPVSFLYLTSIATPLHVFVERYRLVAVPGIALCWALLVSQIGSRALRVGFCVILLVAAAMAQFRDPSHYYSWKGAIQAANENTARDHAPVLICSDLPESNFATMPADPLQSSYFAQLSYYKLNSPEVVPLPRALNHQTEVQMRKFLAVAAPAHQRFFALGYHESWPTLEWIARVTQGAYAPRTIGVYDGVAVVEYDPTQAKP